MDAFRVEISPPKFHPYLVRVGKFLPLEKIFVSIFIFYTITSLKKIKT